MMKRLRFFYLASLLTVSLALASHVRAQQTLGGITGTVTDDSGAVVPGATVTIVGDQTKLTRTLDTNETGAYLFVNLPIGNYTITFTHSGFQTLNIPSIQVQANRTVTVNATLKIGEVSQTITVEETPLLNAVDTTNGYVLDKQQLESIPLPTGSFTGVAILSPGVNAELSSGTGANCRIGQSADLGQRPARHQQHFPAEWRRREQSVQRQEHEPGRFRARCEQHRRWRSPAARPPKPFRARASPYLAIGQALPTPAPETIQEFRVNTSMYDAQQGSTSGAHIDMSTASGTNDIHGSVYVHRGTNWLNAAPYFLQRRTRIFRTTKSSGIAPLHCRRDSGRPDHQEQTLRLRQLPAHCTLPIRKSARRGAAVPFGLIEQPQGRGACGGRQHGFWPSGTIPWSAQLRRYQSDCVCSAELQIAERAVS